MPLADLCDLSGRTTCLDLGGLVGAAHPALMRMLLRPQGLLPGGGGEISEREPIQGDGGQVR